jgi:sugar-phosphatase
MIRIACSAMLFDLDGVLVDSTPAVERVWRVWALKHGFEPAEVVRRAHGRPSITTLREYLPEADHEAENRIVEQCEIEDLEGVVPLTGAPELLRALPPERWAIVTSCTRPLAEVRLRAAGLPRPARFVTSSDVKNGKPSPEPYRKGAEMLGFAPEDCVVVEDAPAGIISGKAAGARVIAFPTTSPLEELRAAGTDWVVKNAAAISLATQNVQDGKLQLVLETRE